MRFAPVIDEYKALDREIVTNSIRFRWRDARDQLRRRLDAPALAARMGEAGAASAGRPPFLILIPAVVDRNRWRGASLP